MFTIKVQVSDGITFSDVELLKVTPVTCTFDALYAITRDSLIKGKNHDHQYQWTNKSKGITQNHSFDCIKLLALHRRPFLRIFWNSLVRSPEESPIVFFQRNLLIDQWRTMGTYFSSAVTYYYTFRVLLKIKYRLSNLIPSLQTPSDSCWSGWKRNTISQLSR